MNTHAPDVREPAVADLFYPKDPAKLTALIDTFLAEATIQPVGELRALVCPHAGYPYSGPTAAYAYKLLEGRHYDTVVVMGPSHYADLSVGSMPRAKIYRTPLGDVSVSAEKVEHLALSGSFSIDPPCRVQRPDWGRAHSLPAMVTAETWEHSVEVEVPFLQRTLDPFGL